MFWPADLDVEMKKECQHCADSGFYIDMRYFAILMCPFCRERPRFSDQEIFDV